MTPRFPLLLLLISVLALADDRGFAVLEAALKAAGGREKLAAVKDLSLDLQTLVIGPQGPLDVKSNSRLVFPSTVRQHSDTPLGRLVLAADSKAGWRQGPQGVTEIPAAEIGRLQSELARSNILFQPPADRAAVRWVGEETIAGRLCDLIELAEVGGAPLRLSVERLSGDVIKRSYRGEAPGGGPANVEEFIGDFRDVGGLRLAFKVRVLRDGKLARESVTQAMRINAGLDSRELLRRPEH